VIKGIRKQAGYIKLGGLGKLLALPAALAGLEFPLVVILLGTLWHTVFDRTSEGEELGEKAVVEFTVRNVRSGLEMEMAERMLTGHEGKIAEMAGSNPVRWLEKPPQGYLGEFSVTPDKFPPSTWYFDKARKVLIYRPARTQNLTCSQCEQEEGHILLSWRIERMGNPMFGRGDRVKIVPVATYQWYPSTVAGQRLE
jgi:hypothetical protein